MQLVSAVGVQRSKIVYRRKWEMFIKHDSIWSQFQENVNPSWAGFFARCESKIVRYQFIIFKVTVL